jgi:hypothetical protein
VKPLFLTRLTRMTGLIEAPSSRDAADALLDHRRSATHTQLLARITGLQAKDVPILILAFKHRNRDPTLLTNDAGFAEFSPSEYNLSEITIKHVP